MNSRIHLIFGAMVYATYGYFFGYDFIPLIVTIFSSILPDIDKFGSRISKKLFPLSMLTIFFKHRGFFHSLLFIGLILFIDKRLFFVALGAASHILLDIFSKSGVVLFWPLPFKIRI